MQSLKYILPLLFFFPFVASAALTDNLIAYWNLNEESGTREDSTAANEDLTDNNTVLFGTGKIGNAADFELSNSESLSNAGITAGNGGDFSISMWVNYEAFTHDGNLFTYGPASVANMLRIVLGTAGGNKMTVEWWDNAVAHSSRTFTLPASSLGTWYHIVATFDVSAGQTGILLYQDGSAVTPTEGDNAASSRSNTTELFALASFRASSNYFDGLQDEIGIWDRVLTSAEVTSLYNGGAGFAYPFTVAAVLITPIPATIYEEMGLLAKPEEIVYV